ncbi:MAG TPA: ABC transporter ATP-binding protein [Candidatus Angelobacter sp.]|jgi:subfamily B ATP-binding cassette protein MsbA|nr:ABC transporter ATP-binding protein [Candidatus Angelobacter sp.]
MTIRQLLRPHVFSLSLGFLAVLGEAIANLLQPWPLKIVLDEVFRTNAGKTAIPGFVHHFLGADKLSMVKFACLAVLAIALLDAVSTYAEKYLTTKVGQWVTYDLRRTLYAHIQRLSLAFHDQKRTGDLISRVISDVDDIQSFINSGLLSTLINVITLLGMVCVMLWINWQFTLIALSVAPVLFAVVYTYTRRIKNATRNVRKKESEVFSVVEEVLSSIRLVKAFAREQYEQERLEEASLEEVDSALRARSLKARLMPLVDMIVAAGTCLVLWFGARLTLSGALSVGSMVLFIQYLSKMYKPMQELSKMTDTYSKAAVGYERIQEIFETDNEVRDLKGAKPIKKIRGKIEFQDVSFFYSADQPIIKNMSFCIEPGQVAAVVGPTGVGKTTIISLVSRFYDPVSGAVKIDGTDIRQFQQQSLRQHISYVLQENVLFHGPLWQNIAYGKPEATQKEIVRAAELANAMEFIEKLPQGFATVVGERGMTLSGGQRQRIAIARAIIRNTPILMLDEPTTGLDAASEKLVFEALDRLMVGKTVIVVAHRLSTIRRADVIYVVDEGTIVEHGKHRELLKNRGLYAQLHDLQFKGGSAA